MKFRIFIILLILTFAANAATFSVGTSPGLINVGEVSAGETKIIKFSIFSISEEPLLVYLGTESGNFDFFNIGYKDSMPVFSEEPIDTWLELLTNPIEIDPEVRKAGKGWVDVNLLLHIPEDAEPGFHVAYVLPTLTVFGQEQAPFGASVASVVKIPIIFSVRGIAKRGGVVLDTTPTSYTERGFRIRTFFQNTGSTTLNAWAINRIYAANETFLAEFRSAQKSIKPEETFPFDTYIPGAFPEGAYKVDSKITFTTGEAEKTSIIDLYAPITGAAVAQPEQFPWLLVLLAVIVIIIAVRWLREKRR